MRSAGVVFASFLAFGVAGCGSKYNQKVIGTWEWKIGGRTLLVTINKDGTGSLKGPGGEKQLKWRIQRGNNLVFNDGSKDVGFLIDSADENTIRGTDPQSPGQTIVWTRKK
jgi:hypothetical protein